jgi:hypothetical protein
MLRQPGPQRYHFAWDRRMVGWSARSTTQRGPVPKAQTAPWPRAPLFLDSHVRPPWDYTQPYPLANATRTPWTCRLGAAYVWPMTLCAPPWLAWGRRIGFGVRRCLLGCHSRFLPHGAMLRVRSRDAGSKWYCIMYAHHAANGPFLPETRTAFALS